MKIIEILSPELIAPELVGNDKDAVLNELAAHLTQRHKEVTQREVVAVLAARERLGSTAIGDGIAIPHGKLAGVSRIVGVLGRHRQGVEFESLDGNPTHLFFLLVAPEDSASLHLKALARVSRLLRDDAFRAHLLEAPDAAEIFRLVKEEDARY